jgi:GABA(A) receptor-associated protein
MQNKNKKFKDNLNMKERVDESAKILKLYPDRIPIIVEKARNSKLPDLDINKLIYAFT